MLSLEGFTHRNRSNEYHHALHPVNSTRKRMKKLTYVNKLCSSKIPVFFSWLVWLRFRFVWPFPRAQSDRFSSKSFDRTTLSLESINAKWFVLNLEFFISKRRKKKETVFECTWKRNEYLIRLLITLFPWIGILWNVVTIRLISSKFNSLIYNNQRI